ncbi:MAG: helix-turn-helix transcriptional regulator, partial [Bacteroidales bacterium]|nr:helix-turn-helix transcriptional regulator [Bacteroidales bacterium]
MDVQINSRIKEIMEHAKLTPSDFSAAIGITRSNLSHILSGRNQPSFSMLEKILKAFPEIRT